MREILVLQLARLGDLVQTAPMLRGLRRAYPQARITLAAQPGPAQLLDGFGLFDCRVPLPYDAVSALESAQAGEGFGGLGPFASEPAFRVEYDLLVNASNDLGSAILCERIPARRKLGRIHTYAGELRLLGTWAKYMYAMVSHRRENMFNLVDIQAGMAELPLTPEPACLPVPEAGRAAARALLADAGVGPIGNPPGRRRPRVALQAGASASHRAWSPDHFAALGSGLLREPGADIVLVGDGSERERCAELAARIGGKGVANLAGRTGLPQLHAVLGECDLLISNDTGSIHVAAAAGTPTLGLYFSTAHYAETAPYGAGHSVLQVEIPCAPCDASNVCAVQRCREYLLPDSVLATARWLLAGFSPDAIPVTVPELSLYRSRFLADGSLAYLPARPASASAAFQEALVGRLLWQEALGLAGDPELRSLAEAFRGEEAFRRKRDALASAFAELEPAARRGLELAGKLRAEFAAGHPARERIGIFHGNLEALAASLAALARPAGLCGAFLNFEMMDVDYVGYPRLAEILEGKYRQLSEWLARFRATLDRLAPGPADRR